MHERCKPSFFHSSNEIARRDIPEWTRSRWLLSAMESEHRSVICPLGEAGKVLDVALSCRVQAVCVVLLLLILGLLCSCLWRQTSQTCQKAQARAGQREFDAVPSGLSGKSEASTAGPEGEAGPASASELPKMASRYSIKSAFSRWTRAKAKVHVVWKLNLQQVQNWLNGKGEAPQLDQKLQVRPADLEAGDDGEQDAVVTSPASQDEGDDGAQVPQERGSLDDPMPPRASAAVGFLQGTALPLPAMPAYADGDRVEYFSPTCGLWLLGEVTVKSDAKSVGAAYDRDSVVKSMTRALLVSSSLLHSRRATFRASAPRKAEQSELSTAQNSLSNSHVPATSNQS
eukprot:s4331_g9.t1